jgi:hypothetical protein
LTRYKGLQYLGARKEISELERGAAGQARQSILGGCGGIFHGYDDEK